MLKVYIHSYINSTTTTKRKKNNYTVAIIMCIKFLKNPSVLHENINVMDTNNNYFSRDTDQ